MNEYLNVYAKFPEKVTFIDEEFWTVLKQIGNAYTASDFRLSVRNNIVLIALSSKKPLQFGFLFRSLLKTKNYDDLINKFTSIFNLVDIFKN